MPPNNKRNRVPAMLSYLRSFRLPEVLDAIVEKRWRELGYPTRSAYFLALTLYDLLIRRKHEVTIAIIRQPEADRDLIYGEIARMFDSGQVEGSSWFEHALEGAIKEVAGGQDIPTHRIVAALIKRVRDRGK